MSSIQLLAFDLDGTLLNNHHQISDYTKNALLKVNNHYQIAICTGRSTSCLLPIFKNFPEEFDFHIVSFNGACSIGKKGEGRKSLFYCPISKSIVNRIIHLSKTNNFVMNFYIDDIIYAHCNNNVHLELTQRYQKLTSCNYKYIDDNYKQFCDIEIPKILILAEEYELDAIEEELIKLFGNDIHITRGFFFIEMLHPSVNKGNGLKGLCESLDIPLSNVISFGDGDNDIEFLSYSGHSIAMKNGTQLAKINAKQISEKTNDEDGVAHELNKLFNL